MATTTSSTETGHEEKRNHRGSSIAGSRAARSRTISHELPPAPMIKLHNLGESSVDFVVRPWVETPDYWEVYWDLTRQVKEAFDELVLWAEQGVRPEP